MKPKEPTSEGKPQKQDKPASTNEEELYQWAEEAAMFESKNEPIKHASMVKDLRTLYQSEKKILSIKPSKTQEKPRVLTEINEQNSK